MEQRFFKNSWLLPCSLRSHRTANPTPQNGLRHFSALPTHHPKMAVNTVVNESQSLQVEENNCDKGNTKTNLL